ncbi:MAG: flagellar hook-length control protein FliK [Chitinivibrionia bacterium]|nr:flagellar hook-length control protein FliK [Chitinivibrionia bacterium]
MVQQAEKRNGFFESVAESRTVSTHKNRRAENLGSDDGERFQQALQTVRARRASAPDAPREEALRFRERRQANAVNPQADAEMNKHIDFITGEEYALVQQLLQENVSNETFALVAPQTNFDVEIENANSSFAAVNLAGIEDLGFDIRMDAIENIEAILRTVSEMLNLKINTELPMVYHDGEKVPEEIVANLAQVLFVFKQIADAFLQSGLDGKEVGNNGQIFSPKQALEMGKYLQQELLKLELSFAQLGISQALAEQAVKINPSVEADKNLHFAADLQSRTPAQQILPKTIDNILLQPQDLIKTQVSELKALVEQLKDMMSDAKTKIENANASTGSATAEKVVVDVASGSTATKAPVIEALSELKKEIAKDKMPKIDETTAPTSEKAKTDKSEIQSAIKTVFKTVFKSEVETEAKAEIKPEVVAEVKAKTKESGKENGETKPAVADLTQTVAKKQAKAEAKQAMTAEEVLKNEFVSSMKAATVRANEGNIASPVALDGVMLETQKFSDSGEISTVSPRFAKLFDKEIIEQVQRTLLNAINKNGIRLSNGTHEITITLTPEKLGEVRLRIQVEGNKVSAIMNVDNLQVKAIVEQNLQQLRDALAKQDLAAGTLDVNVGNDDARDLQERLHNAKLRAQNAKGFNAEEGVMTDDAFEWGMDTGRRFGTNSFEYFA